MYRTWNTVPDDDLVISTGIDYTCCYAFHVLYLYCLHMPKWILHNYYITVQEPAYFTSSVKYKVITLLRTIRSFWSTLYIAKHAVFLNIQLNLKINSIVFLPMTNRTISINYFLWIYCIKLPWLLLLFPICRRHRAIVRASCLQAKPALCREMSTLEKEIGFWGQSESRLVLNQLTNCSNWRVRAKSGIF